MRQILISLMFLVFFEACKKNTDPKPSLPEGYFGEVVTERNGKKWTGYTACWIDIIDQKNININLDSFENGYFLRESLTLYTIPPKTGTYKVYRLAPSKTKLHSSFGVWEGDLPLGEYEILEADSATNTVTLSTYDTLSKEIKGTFNLSFIVTDKPYPTYPDTIRLKNGKFSGKLIKK